MALEASIKQNHGIEEKKEVMSGVLKTPNRLHFLPILWFLKLQNLLHQNTFLLSILKPKYFAKTWYSSKTPKKYFVSKRA
jgi:hypothetical protein